MRKTNYILVLSMLCLLSSCGIYKNYHRPDDLPLDSLYRDIHVNEQDTLLFADMSWRELFTDTCLVKWIETGLSYNTDLQTARLRTEEARATLVASKQAFLPSVSLSPQGSLNSVNGDTPAKSYSISGTLEWEIDAFGSLLNAKKSNLSAYEASRAYEQAVQTQLIATIADTYYSIVTLDKKLSLTQETVEKWRENLRVMNALKKAGQTNEAAIAQSTASLISAEASVLSYTKQIRELENSFSSLLGISPQNIERSDLFDLSCPTNLSMGVPAALLEKRPDVRQAEYKLAQAFYATNRARSAFYPRITLSGSAGWTNNVGVSVSNPGAWLLNAVGSLVQPLFNKGTNRANLQIAKAQQKEALLAFGQKLLDAGTEVNNALVQWQTAQAALELDKKQIDVLNSAVESTRKLMRYGNINYLEVLTAQQSLLQSQLTAASDKYNEIQGLINLYHALGGGIK